MSMSSFPAQELEAARNTPEVLADPYLFRIRDLIYRASGIFQPDNKFTFWKTAEQNAWKRSASVRFSNTTVC